MTLTSSTCRCLSFHSLSKNKTFQLNVAFLDALASLKTMFQIKYVIHVFKVMRFQEYYRVLKSIAESYRVLQSVTEYYRVLQSITEYYRAEYYRVMQSIALYCRVFQAHLLGPIFGLVLILITKKPRWMLLNEEQSSNNIFCKQAHFCDDRL